MWILATAVYTAVQHVTVFRNSFKNTLRVSYSTHTVHVLYSQLWKVEKG